MAAQQGTTLSTESKWRAWSGRQIFSPTELGADAPSCGSPKDEGLLGGVDGGFRARRVSSEWGTPRSSCTGSDGDFVSTTGRGVGSSPPVLAWGRTEQGTGSASGRSLLQAARNRWSSSQLNLCGMCSPSVSMGRSFRAPSSHWSPEGSAAPHALARRDLATTPWLAERFAEGRQVGFKVQYVTRLVERDIFRAEYQATVRICAPGARSLRLVSRYTVLATRTGRCRLVVSGQILDSMDSQRGWIKSAMAHRLMDVLRNAVNTLPGALRGYGIQVQLVEERAEDGLALTRAAAKNCDDGSRSVTEAVACSDASDRCSSCGEERGLSPDPLGSERRSTDKAGGPLWLSTRLLRAMVTHIEIHA